MTNLILHNAYGILGLTPNATRKEIERQTKEIEKLLKIGEIPRYNLDLSHFDSLRDEKNVKEAKQNLLNIDTKILHYFFAIYILSEQDRESFLQQAQNLYVSEDFSAKTFIEKKNIAISLYIYISQNGICISVKRYFQLWAEILSIENIEKFKRLYKHDDDLGINDSALNELDSTIRNKAILLQSTLSDFIKDDEMKIKFIANIIKTFNPSDEVLENISLISDIFKRANNLINAIEKSSIIDTLKSNILKLKCGIYATTNLGLQNHSQTIMLKDRAAKILRNKSIYFHNEMHDINTALMLIDEAYLICGSDFEKNQIKKDIERLKEVAKHNEIANLLDKAKSKADAGEFYEYVFDEIAENICKISPNDSDDYIDQIAIIIGNKAIETANIKQQSLNLYDNSEAIVRLNSIYETFETRLNLAKRYAKKSKTLEWLNNQIPKGSERDMLRTVANRISGGSHTASNGESSGWGTIFWWIVIIFAIALVAKFPWLLIVVGFILMAIFGK